MGPPQDQQARANLTLGRRLFSQFGSVVGILSTVRLIFVPWHVVHNDPSCLIETERSKASCIWIGESESRRATSIATNANAYWKLVYSRQRAAEQHRQQQMQMPVQKLVYYRRRRIKQSIRSIDSLVNHRCSSTGSIIPCFCSFFFFFLISPTFSSNTGDGLLTG